MTADRRFPFGLLVSILVVLTGARLSEAAPPVNATARRGVAPRTENLKNAPAHGLVLESVGLVNETFRITVNFDTKQIVRVTRYAKDNSEEKASRALTAAELTGLWR